MKIPNIIALFLLTIITVRAQALQNIIFFGDSLSDNGNLYRNTLHHIPSSPPYFDGRFSNGPTWAENVGSYYQNHFNSSYAIYAWGGATLRIHLPNQNFIAPISLNGEITIYLLNTLFSDRSNNLYVIWMGDNDYIFYPSNDLESVTDKSIANLEAGIRRLIAHGARKILVLNLTDASITPALRGTPTAKTLHDTIVLHNQKLAALLKQLQSSYPDTNIYSYDAYSFFNDYANHYPVYNSKYHVNLKDNIHPCLSSTDIPCSPANSFIYWDTLHPTETFHYILGQIIIKKINGEIK